MIKLLFSYLFGGIATGFISAIATILITRMLSTDVYGKGMLFMSLVAILFSFCNMGMDQVFVRFFYELKYKENLSLLLYRCLCIVACGVVIVSLIMFLFQHEILKWLMMDNSMMIPFLVMGMILFALLRFLQLISRLRENTQIYILAGFFEQLFFIIIFVVLFYTLTTGYLAIVLSQLMSMALVVTGLLLIYKKELFLGFSKSTKIVEAKETKAFLNYGVPNFFSLSLNWLFANIDKLFILKWSNYSELGLYSAAFALTAPLLLVQTTFTTAWAPRMNYMLIHSPFKSKKYFSLTFEKLSFLLTFLFLVIVMLKDYLILFVGPDFSQAVNIFPWLLFAPYFWALSEVVVAGVIKSKKSYWQIYCSFCAVCVNALSCFILIPWVGGAKGAAISVAISFGVFFLTRWHVAFRYYSFRIRSFKLMTYVTLICVDIILGTSHVINYLFLIIFVVIVAILEKNWLYKDICSIGNSRQTIDKVFVTKTIKQ